MTKKLRYELVLLTAVGVASVLSGIAPASRTVWFTEMFWAWGLLAILLLTYRRFKFSIAAYSCFFVWSLLQIVGAHWTFERVPMEWLTTPLGLERNPFDRIAHFAVGWFAFPLSELYWRKGYVRSKVAAVFFAVMTTVAMAGLWESAEGHPLRHVRRYLLDNAVLVAQPFPAFQGQSLSSRRGRKGL